MLELQNGNKSGAHGEHGLGPTAKGSLKYVIFKRLLNKLKNLPLGVHFLEITFYNYIFVHI